MTRVGLNIGPVICRMCEHPVDRITFYEDLSTMEMVMVAHCHGDEDERRISNRPQSLEDAIALEDALARGGEAFTTKMIGKDHT